MPYIRSAPSQRMVHGIVLDELKAGCPVMSPLPRWFSSLSSITNVPWLKWINSRCYDNSWWSDSYNLETSQLEQATILATCNHLDNFQPPFTFFARACLTKILDENRRRRFNSPVTTYSAHPTLAIGRRAFQLKARRLPTRVV